MGRAHRQKAKEYDRDTIPGDYATLKTPCPNCGGVVKENYGASPAPARPGPAKAAGFSISKIPGSRAFRARRGRAVPREQEDWPARGFSLQGGVAVHGRAQAGLRRRAEELEARIRLPARDARRKASRASPFDFSGQESLGRWPEGPGARVRATAPATCASMPWAPTSPATSRAARSSLQQPVAREQNGQTAAHRQDDLLDGFVSNKTRRKFKARAGLRRQGRQGQLRVRASRCTRSGQEGLREEGRLSAVLWLPCRPSGLAWPRAAIRCGWTSASRRRPTARLRTACTTRRCVCDCAPRRCRGGPISA